MQSKRLHKESFLWNDLFHDKNKSEPIANRRKVRIYSLWWSPRDGTRTPKIIVLRDYVVLRIAV